MPKQADQYRLVVSGLRGTVYIAKTTKTPYIMSDNRREVPKSEFLDAVMQYTLSQTSKNKNVMSITIDGKEVAEIVIKDRDAIDPFSRQNKKQESK